MQYVHWLKIDGTVSDRDEKRQYQEIQSYIDRYPEAKVTMYLYEYHLFHRIIKLECNQNWNDLDLDANTGSHRLRRLSRKPDNIGYEQPFKIPEYLNKEHKRHESDHSER